jgi:hypothetical protein
MFSLYDEAIVEHRYKNDKLKMILDDAEREKKEEGVKSTR